MRVPLLAANWKMHKTAREARVLVEDLLKQVGAVTGREMALCPPFPYLGEVSDHRTLRATRPLPRSGCRLPEEGAGRPGPRFGTDPVRWGNARAARSRPDRSGGAGTASRRPAGSFP
ncbi:hypothetical protein DYH09_35715 [bacterium CPR1]|nr:hypothetical protein [bacterium CPR1]